MPVHCPYEEQLKASVQRLASMAFEEDLPHGDWTSDTLELHRLEGEARVICREPVVMNGALWTEDVVAALQPGFGEGLRIEWEFDDGEELASGSHLFHVRGSVAAIMALERTWLNFLCRGVGISIATQAVVRAVRDAGCHASVLDTRKTLPGYRFFDKYAVLCGGGANHRMNLSEHILVKENHIARWGGIPEVMERIRGQAGPGVRVELEVRNLDELQQAIAQGCHIIMLDNFSPRDVWRACELDRGHSLLEVSGGMTIANIRDYSHPTLDRISIGSLTHSVKAPDLSLLLHAD